MDFAERLRVTVVKKLDDLANEIQAELRAEVERYSDTGRENKIHISHESELSRFIGATDRGLYYLDKGSGPVNGKHMGFPEPKGWVDRGNVWEGKVHIYRRKAIEGKHFVKAVADRHR